MILIGNCSYVSPDWCNFFGLLQFIILTQCSFYCWGYKTLSLVWMNFLQFFMWIVCSKACSQMNPEKITSAESLTHVIWWELMLRPLEVQGSFLHNVTYRRRYSHTCVFYIPIASGYPLITTEQTSQWFLLCLGYKYADAPPPQSPWIVIRLKEKQEDECGSEVRC